MTEKTMAFLEYSFLFDPSEGWSHLFEFENDLARFFSDRGFEPVVIKTVDGVGAKRILYLRKAPIVTNVVPSAGSRSPGTILRRMGKHTPSSAEKGFATKKLNLSKPLRRIR